VKETLTGKQNVKCGVGKTNRKKRTVNVIKETLTGKKNVKYD
jgi:hypothetical protein